MKTFYLAFVLTLSFTSFADDDLPGKGIPSECQASLENVHVNYFDGILTQENLRYEPAQCAGLVDRWGNNNCMIVNKPETCVRQESTFQFQDPEGTEQSLVGLKELCNYIARKNKDYDPKTKYICDLNHIQQSARRWVPKCEGSVSLTSGELLREPNKEEVREQKCRAISKCLERNSLSFFKRSTAKKWYNTLKCENF